ncbi:MAG: RelA/SpoT domain-containing protein [Pontibacter sp.]|nr:RelA/SpoT domain-containing protein [Pontibacter sp.]
MSKKDVTHKATVPFILSVLNVSEEELRSQGLDAKALAAIYNDYLSRQHELADAASMITEMLRKVEGVHSVTYRVKDPEHLLQKILRKKKEYPNRTFTPQSYLSLINDLVGVRVLHLYKEAWMETGKYIQQTWDLKRPPYAYTKGNESNSQLSDFTTLGCKVLTHPSGYKAVHFVIETKPGKQLYFAEIQLRTLFEEGWSEIDHNIRYPDHNNSQLLDCMLQLLNKITTQADELASRMRVCTNKIRACKEQGDFSRLAKELQKLVQELPVQEEEKKQLYACLARMTGKANE